MCPTISFTLLDKKVFFLQEWVIFNQSDDSALLPAAPHTIINYLSEPPRDVQHWMTHHRPSATDGTNHKVNAGRCLAKLSSFSFTLSYCRLEQILWLIFLSSSSPEVFEMRSRETCFWKISHIALILCYSGIMSKIECISNI